VPSALTCPSRDLILRPAKAGAFSVPRKRTNFVIIHFLSTFYLL